MGEVTKNGGPGVSLVCIWILILPLTSFMTPDKLTSLHLSFLRCKMRIKKHIGHNIQHLLSTSYVFYILTLLILIITWLDGYYHFPHLKMREVKHREVR